VLRQRPQWLAAAGGLIDNGRHVWVGRNVRIDPTANLLGPIAIGDDVEIGPGAVIAGPATIGHGCRIGAGMIIKRSVLLPNATLAGGAFNGRALSHAIVPGGGPGVVQTIGQRGELQLQACSIDRHIHLESVLENPSTPALTPFVFGIFRFTKRFVDIVGSLVALILTVPFYPFVALAIKLNSPGPIFYGHTRQGMNGRNFACFKFRTMIVHAEEMKRKLITRNEVDGPQFKMRDDPRIFFVGRILRRLNIDEFPQFFNVLLGQMSLVGPRPSPERENQLCPAWREARLSVRPGITGLWQVMRGRDRGETDFQEWIYYDIQYVKKQSFWLDTKIVLKTFIVALGSGE